MIAGVFLAAGAGRRFGADKLLADVGGKPLIYHSLKPAVESSLPRVYVVTGAANAALERRIGELFPAGDKIVTVHNKHPQRGMMSSLKAALRTLDPDCSGAMVLLADMPGLTPPLIDTLLGAFDNKDTIIVPECNGEWRHPRIIPKRYFPDFLRLDDDASGMQVIDRHRGDVQVITTGREPDYADIDSPADLDAFS
ncbi:MAG: NTP transferase domain-containing protein [Candidatus Krumholzibacteriia bacterium]